MNGMCSEVSAEKNSHSHKKIARIILRFIFFIFSNGKKIQKAKEDFWLLCVHKDGAIQCAKRKAMDNYPTCFTKNDGTLYVSWF